MANLRKCSAGCYCQLRSGKYTDLTSQRPKAHHALTTSITPRLFLMSVRPWQDLHTYHVHMLELLTACMFVFMYRYISICLYHEPYTRQSDFVLWASQPDGGMSQHHCCFSLFDQLRNGETDCIYLIMNSYQYTSSGYEHIHVKPYMEQITWNCISILVT
jgi:hypothetical protein